MQLNNRALNVPDSARASVAQGRLVEAIKSLRDANPGLQLRDAKAAVDALATHAPAAATGTGRPGREKTAPSSGSGVEAAVARGDLIGAIKALRESTPMSLSQAKTEIEQRMTSKSAHGPAADRPAAQPIHTPTIAPGDSPGGLRWLLVVAVVAVLAGVVLALRG